MSTAAVRRRPDLALTGVALAVVLAGALTTDGFLTTDNFRAILASVGILGIVAVGMACITVSGNLFSLSLGATVAIASITFLSWLHLGVGVAILLSAVLAAVVGALQGSIIALLGANPIVVTIGFGSLQLAAAAKFTNGQAVYPSGSGFSWLAATVGGIPVSVFFLVGLVVVLDSWLRFSRLGRELYLSGENRLAARAAALRVSTATVVAFALAGLCAGLAGVLLAATNKNATLVGGTLDPYTINAVAVVLVGGIAATGGHGAVGRAVAGALFIAAISDMLLLRGYSTGIQTAVAGAFVFLAIVVMQLRRTER